MDETDADKVHSPLIERRRSKSLTDLSSDSRRVLSELSSGDMILGSAPPRPPRRRQRPELLTSLPARSLHTLSPIPSSPAAFRPSLELPRPGYARSTSPSAESVATVTPAPESDLESSQETTLASSIRQGVRDMTLGHSRTGSASSASRRMGALCDLVSDLDLTQSWGTSPGSSGTRVQGIDYAEPYRNSCYTSSSSEESSLVSPPLVGSPVLRPVTVRNDGHESEDLGLSYFEPKPIPLPPIPVEAPSPTPLSRRTPSKSSLRQKRLATPEPPRPASRGRTEVFDVAWSGYGRCLEPSSPIASTAPSADKTWRSTLASESTFTSVLSTHGAAEVKRQEIMWEMCETEKGFVDSMKMVLRLFASPLKMPQGRWIEGIPQKATELFDYLQTIVHVHAALVKSQKDITKDGVIDVTAFISDFKPWLSRLSVHEPFLLEFEEVIRLIDTHAKDANSVFGEFLRMHTGAEVLGSMTLTSMLLKPIQRLTKYHLFLKNLLDATPYPHPAHYSLVSLLQVTEATVTKVQASKAREEDLESLKILASSVHGLPDGLKLAERGRKFLGHGTVLKVVLGHDELPPSGRVVQSRSRSESVHSYNSGRNSVTSSVSSSAPSTSSPFPSSDFTSSYFGPSSRSSAFSISSFGSSYLAPSRSNSLTVPRSSPKLPSRPPSAASVFSLSRPGSAASMRGGRLCRKEEPLTLLVFNDMVILAQAEKAGGVYGRRRDKGFKVCENGAGRVVEVRDLKGWNGRDQVFSVTIIPNHSNNPITMTYYFQLPSVTTASAPHLRRKHSSRMDLSHPSLCTAEAFIDSLYAGLEVGGGWIAVLGNPFLILTRRFRILPQSICNRYGLAIGSTFAPLVRFLIVLMYPIAKPIGIVLHFVLGAHSDPVTYRTAELKTFVSLGVEDKLEEDELGLLGSVLEFSGKIVEDIMASQEERSSGTVVDMLTRPQTSHEDMYALSAERIVDGELVKEILKKGYSRIPVYEPSSRDSGNITIRALVGYDWTDLKPVSDLVTQALPQCFFDLNLIEAMS
ncbi:hypothetical protein L198_04097 [Cryptococcus wingfieldii CBS 7118]|uniref:DH domain-containing protein n=1 Tax=Cryptococcus wingfieldii CBS 7118 TaxID=1295528 RepID=A0A1E3J689_9TREE|nr:hypothetical protein L198_04097 [Cryptococcus wingfieldii CBS 7118]ODN96383.1 hypothetical protein L198_04097 [Cryptococcus wingfieldii CBS 7118]